MRLLVDHREDLIPNAPEPSTGFASTCTNSTHVEPTRTLPGQGG